MKLIVDNIGKIKHAEIELNGVTVIAGDNNTGKSTIGKILYCMFNSCYNIEEYIDSQKYNRINYEIERVIRSHLVLDINSEDNAAIELLLGSFHINQRNIKKMLNVMSSSALPKEEIVYDFLMKNLDSEVVDRIDSMDDVCTEIISKIGSLLNLPTKNYRISRISNFFNSVFHEQIVNVLSDSGKITAHIKDNIFIAEFDKEKCVDLTLDFIFNNSALLIDTPDVFRSIPTDRRVRYNTTNPIGNLLSRLYQDIESDSVDVDHTLAADKLSKVNAVLNQAVCGKFQKNESRHGESFLFSGMDKPIKIHNLSTGVKSFLLLKKLCGNSILVEKDVLILDEPEIHLHPEWQLLYAEAIVLLQKEFDLTVLITSHSPTFVRAIECYCDIYDRMENLDVYKTEPIDDFNYTLKNISYSEYGISELYEEFSAPFEKLDELISEKYSQEDE